jgi:hypothetical protein
LSDIRNPPKHGLKASASFAQDTAPSLDEVLGAGPRSKATYSTLDRVLSTCTTYTVKDNGQTETVHVGAMSFPTVGQQSSANALTLTVDGINLWATSCCLGRMESPVRGVRRHRHAGHHTN